MLRNTLSAILALLSVAATLLLATSFAASAGAADYSVYSSWAAMDRAKYATTHRISGTNGYTGFWFFGAEQFDISNRYALAMTVYCKDRKVTKDDVGDIGYFDLQDGNRWTKTGATTAWNWQQGCRLQWRLNSDEIAWNDRAPDNSHFITKLYNFKTKTTRTLPQPVYHISPDGKLIDGTLGYFLRPGAHSLTPQDWKAFLDFADKHLKMPKLARTGSL